MGVIPEQAGLGVRPTQPSLLDGWAVRTVGVARATSCPVPPQGL